MKAIFLDIDGVLNCHTSRSRCDGFIGIDDDKVKRLRRIVENTGAKIILTSTWKSGWEKIYKDDQSESAKYLDRKLGREMLNILDKTIDDGPHRGYGIVQWTKKMFIENFVILDDETFDYEECGLIPKLVKTGFYDGGLQDEHVDAAIKLLNTK